MFGRIAGADWFWNVFEFMPLRLVAGKVERLPLVAAAVLDCVDDIGSIVYDPFVADLKDDPPVGLIAANCIVPPRLGYLPSWPNPLFP